MNHHLVFHAFDSPARLILGGLAILAAAFLLTRLLQFERQLVPPRSAEAPPRAASAAAAAGTAAAAAAMASGNSTAMSM